MVELLELLLKLKGELHGSDQIENKIDKKDRK